MCLKVALSLHERVSWGLLQELVHPPSPSQCSLLLLARFLAEPIMGTSSSVWQHGHFPLLPRDGCSMALGFVPFALLRLQDNCPFGGARGFARRSTAVARIILLPLSSSAPSSQRWVGVEDASHNGRRPTYLSSSFHNPTALSTPENFCCLWVGSMKPRHPGLPVAASADTT